MAGWAFTLDAVEAVDLGMAGLEVLEGVRLGFAMEGPVVPCWIGSLNRVEGVREAVGLGASSVVVVVVVVGVGSIAFAS